MSYASYPRSSVQERKSITILESALSSKNFVPNISKNDKTPCKDGYIELLNAEGQNIADVTVQVKTLPDEFKGDPRYPIPVSLFEFAHSALVNPFIFIAVDNESETAYWLHIDEELRSRLELKPGQKTKRIYFPEKNVITRDNNDCYYRWIGIFKKIQYSISGVNIYKLISEIRGEYYKDEPILNRYYYVHQFIDHLNHLLNNDLKTLKNTMNPMLWKYGVILYNYTERSLSYALYPVYIYENDTLVKEITNPKDREKMFNVYGFSYHTTKNPIRENPYNHAIDRVKSMASTFFEKKLLNIDCNEMLTMDYASCFLNNFHRVMYLDDSESYSMKDILESIESIFKDLQTRITEPKSENITFGRGDYPFKVYVDSVYYLKNKNIEAISPIFIPKNYEREQGMVSYIYNLFSPEDYERNLKTYYSIYYGAHNDVVNHNFPQLNDKLKSNLEYNNLVLILNTKEYYERGETPTYKLALLYQSGLTCAEINSYNTDSVNHEMLNSNNIGKKIEFNGIEYKLAYCANLSLEFLCRDFFLYNKIIEEIERNLNRYLDSIKLP